MRYTGKIIRWKDGKGFGFIEPHAGGPEVFVHIKAFADRQRRPAESALVTYTLKTDAKGRVQAANVNFAGAATPAPAPARPARGNSALVCAGFFLAALAVLVGAGRLPPGLLWLYAGASCVTFIAYALDKSAAQKGRWRTPEKTLHLLALIGGWPGALAAQKLLRHKSSKQSFQIVFWITVLLNCGALVWLLLPAGAATLRNLMTAW